MSPVWALLREDGEPSSPPAQLTSSERKFLNYTARWRFPAKTHWTAAAPFCPGFMVHQLLTSQSRPHLKPTRLCSAVNWLHWTHFTLREVLITGVTINTKWWHFYSSFNKWVWFRECIWKTYSLPPDKTMTTGRVLSKVLENIEAKDILTIWCLQSKQTAYAPPLKLKTFQDKVSIKFWPENEWHILPGLCIESKIKCLWII